MPTAADVKVRSVSQPLSTYQIIVALFLFHLIDLSRTLDVVIFPLLPAFSYEIKRPSFHLFKHPAQVLPEHPEANQLDAPQEQHSRHQRGITR